MTMYCRMSVPKLVKSRSSAGESFIQIKLVEQVSEAFAAQMFCLKLFLCISGYISFLKEIMNDSLVNAKC